MSELHQRITDLERKNQWMFRLLLSFLALFSIFLFMGLKNDKIIQAQGFVLVDDAGKKRAELSFDDNQRASSRLLFYDRHGEKVRMNLSVQKDSTSSIVFYDQSQKPRAMLSTNRDGNQAWVLYDASQVARATFATRKDGSPVLFFSNKKGEIVKVLPK